MSSSRFNSPASDFDLAELVGRLRPGLLLSLALAVGLTLIFVALNPFRQVEIKAPRPLSTKFIKREPRLTKPLELRKIPKPKRQLARRQVHLAAARLDLVDWRDIVNGYFIHGRMVGIDNVGWGSNPRYNQMAVNVIVYALTQEGSITQRLMQGVN